jgi:glycosyltransferase involved in cell wall biosynthesis
MVRHFIDHFRCPDDSVQFQTATGLQSEAGFFRYGSDIVCFGQNSSMPVRDSYLANLQDAAPATSKTGNAVVLPFDPDQIADNLRGEIYTGQMQPDFTRLGSHPTIRSMYYWGRPLLPVPMRSVLQRIYLRGELSNPFPVWPVDRTVETLFERMMLLALKAKPGEKIPFIWFWPDGAEAAFILTHDVESATGKDFTHSVMDIDEQYGLRAAFQVIPEKRYEVSLDFIRGIRARGFEANVHDLNHDGNLFRERQEFLQRAERINSYAREFGSQGFRSGALYRNPLWYDAFQFSFDMSIPNVGHLDPQGGGCCTTFPYFIGNILEIPVTCTQDYSLFHILNQYSINLWKRQFGIIAGGHGLISIIIHPDYVVERRAQDTFRELLSFVREQVKARGIWATLPGEINRWWRSRRDMKLVRRADRWVVEGAGSERARVAYACLEDGRLTYSFEDSAPDRCDTPVGTIGLRETDPLSSLPVSSAPELQLASVSSTAVAVEEPPAPMAAQAPSFVDAPSKIPHKPLRVAMVTYSFYETDNRVMRYAETLAKRGDHVEVFALRREGKPSGETINGVVVRRLQVRQVNEKHRSSYAWRLSQFFLRALFQISRHDLKQKYDLLHIHSVPDFMVFTALLPRLRGTPVILDIHDILPEFYASKFGSGQSSASFKTLLRVEKYSAKFASHVIIANHIWKDRLISRSVAAEKCSVVLNSPDRSIFTADLSPRPTQDRFVVLYPGSLNWHQGLDIAIRAFAKIRDAAPNAYFYIYGDGPSKEELAQLARSLGLNGRVVMPSALPLREIARVMQHADLGIVPKRKNSFGNEAFSTKILEFMAMNVPVIIPDTKVDKYYFDDSVVQFFRAGDEDDLAKRMLELISDPGRRQMQAERASRFVASIDWDAKQHEYLSLVDQLAATER